MKKLFMAAVLVSVLSGAVFLAGCADRFGWTWEFQNRSSYTLEITPNGQSWLGFVLAPGQDREVRVTEDDGTAHYFYTRSDRVRKESNPKENNHIIFYNR